MLKQSRSSLGHLLSLSERLFFQLLRATPKGKARAFFNEVILMQLYQVTLIVPLSSVKMGVKQRGFFLYMALLMSGVAIPVPQIA